MSSAFGIFENQPTDVILYILDRVPNPALISLSRSSRSWRQVIAEHVNREKFLSSWLRRVGALRDAGELKEELESYREIGHLVGEVAMEEEHRKFKEISGRVWRMFENPEGVGCMLRAYCTHLPRHQLPVLFKHIWALIPSLETDIREVVDQILLPEHQEKVLKVHNLLHALFLDNQFEGLSGRFLVEIYKRFLGNSGNSSTVSNVLYIMFAWKPSNGVLNLTIYHRNYRPEHEEAVLRVATTFKTLMTDGQTNDERLKMVINRVVDSFGGWCLFAKVRLLAYENSLLSAYILHHGTRDTSQVLFHLAIMLRESGTLPQFQSALRTAHRNICSFPNGANYLQMLHLAIRLVTKNHQARMMSNCAHFNPSDNPYIRCFQVFLS